jgi:predicted phosphodiesterase
VPVGLQRLLGGTDAFDTATSIRSPGEPHAQQETVADGNTTAMTNPPLLNRKLHALLIGVDCYLPNELPDGGFYPSLGGCVRDINHVETFLTNRLGLSQDQIIKLTASNGKTDKPTESEKDWPTYENMVKAFQEITRRANSGEQVYIHYSGHGGRSVTSFPQLKGDKGLDESLVPTDIGNSEARYLRDVEMAHLLKEMSDKKLVVTLVLDSCHSGGATRGFSGGAVRGISSIDSTKRPSASLAGTPEELAATWLSVSANQSRSAKIGAGWAPEVSGVLLLAACRADELANEAAFEGSERNGALTYWMLDGMKQIGPGMTFKMLHDRVLAKVHAAFKQQTPQIHGDAARIVFDTNRAPSPSSVRVIDVDKSKSRVKLQVGKVQGVENGARFSIYAPGTTQFDDSVKAVNVEISEAGDTDSWATIVDKDAVNSIVIGAEAVLLDAGTVRLRGRVRLIEQKTGVPKEIDQAAELAKAGKEIEASSWIRLAKDDEQTDFQLAVNANGEYEVWDASGHPISLRPPLPINDKASSESVTKRLVHLTKFRNVKLIENGSSTSPLARQLKVELTGDAVTGDTGIPVLDVGESANLRITNNSSKVLNITIFDLRPDWGVVQVYPADADSEILDPKGTLDLPLTDVSLPAGYTEGQDTIKVFATVESTSFRWLELPSLDQPQQRSMRRAPADPLEQLMAAFTAEAPPQNVRSFNLGSASVSTWTAAQIDFRVRQPRKGLRPVRDISTALLQSAFDEVAAEKAQTRSRAIAGIATTRASVDDPVFNAMTDVMVNPEEAERGVMDTVKYCASLAKGMAGQLWNAYYHGNRADFDAYKDALTVKFGDCDPNFKDALVKYAEFVLRRGKIPYQPYGKLSDSVFENGALPTDATIGVVADWGTGQPEAIEVLRQVKNQNPKVVIHLGDIYYAGTGPEVENYFTKPWNDVLQPATSGIASFALPGNHDYYSGGQAFFDLVTALGQRTSFFCLRNEDWQFIGLDTALNDRLNGPPTSLHKTEVEWLQDKIDTAGKRRTCLLSHHQLFSTNDRWDDQSHNENLYNQLRGMLDRVDVWLWGHEHDLVIFNEFMGLKRGRCIGGSAFPVGKYEMAPVPENADVPFNKEVMLSKGPAFYQHCYAMIKLDGPTATVSYYEDSDGGRLLFSETV